MTFLFYRNRETRNIYVHVRTGNGGAAAVKRKRRGKRRRPRNPNCQNAVEIKGLRFQCEKIKPPEILIMQSNEKCHASSHPEKCFALFSLFLFGLFISSSRRASFFLAHLIWLSSREEALIRCHPQHQISPHRSSWL